VLIDRDYHLVDADLRQRFVETRDERAAMIYHEPHPGLARPPDLLVPCQSPGRPTALRAIPPSLDHFCPPLYNPVARLPHAP